MQMKNRDPYHTHELEMKSVKYIGSYSKTPTTRPLCIKCSEEKHEQVDTDRCDCKNLFFKFIRSDGTELTEEYQKQFFNLYLAFGLDDILSQYDLGMKIVGQCCCYSEKHRGRAI